MGGANLALDHVTLNVTHDGAIAVTFTIPPDQIGALATLAGMLTARSGEAARIREAIEATREAAAEKLAADQFECARLHRLCLNVWKKTRRRDLCMQATGMDGTWVDIALAMDRKTNRRMRIAARNMAMIRARLRGVPVNRLAATYGLHPKSVSRLTARAVRSLERCPATLPLRMP